MFDFLVANPEDPESPKPLTGQLFSESRIFSAALDTGITEITTADLAVDDLAGVDAVLVPSGDDTGADTMNISLMLAHTPVEIDFDHLKGEILSIDAAAGTLMVASDAGDGGGNSDADTKIF